MSEITLYEAPVDIIHFEDNDDWSDAIKDLILYRFRCVNYRRENSFDYAIIEKIRDQEKPVILIFDLRFITSFSEFVTADEIINLFNEGNIQNFEPFVISGYIQEDIYLHFSQSEIPETRIFSKGHFERELFTDEIRRAINNIAIYNEADVPNTKVHNPDIIFEIEADFPVEMKKGFYNVETGSDYKLNVILESTISINEYRSLIGELIDFVIIDPQMEINKQQLSLIVPETGKRNDGDILISIPENLANENYEIYLLAYYKNNLLQTFSFKLNIITL